MERRLMIAGGGTGGHLFPGMAVAREFLDRDAGHRVLFVGTSKGIESRLVPEAGFDLRVIRSRGIAGKGKIEKLKALAVIPLSILDAAGVVRSFKPQAALGVGGYVSGPATLAAWAMGVPAAVHEQNAVPGMTNRILSRIAKTVFISLPVSRSWFSRADEKGRVVLSGNPVRKEIVKALTVARPGVEDAGPIRILVVGGSQGAHGLNLLVADAVEKMVKSGKRSIEVTHQTGKRDFEDVKARYEKLEIDFEVKEFITDMAKAYLDADLIVSRSGAGAVAEIALAGLPAVLVPFPYAAADHQAINAEALVKNGGAVMFREGEVDGDELAKALIELMDDPYRRGQMAKKSAELAAPESAKVIVDGLISLMERGAEN